MDCKFCNIELSGKYYQVKDRTGNWFYICGSCFNKYQKNLCLLEVIKED